MKSRRTFWIPAETGTGCQSEGGECKGAQDGHTNKGQIDNLEQPRWDLGAKNGPAVVLFVAIGEQRSACGREGVRKETRTV
jgi:hypothetical protein